MTSGQNALSPGYVNMRRRSRMLLRIKKSRRVIEAGDDLRLVTSQIKDNKNMAAQTTRLNG
jgi:hypothetical protein